MPIDVANPGGALSPFSRGNAISPWFEMSILTPASSAKAPIYSCCWIFSSRTNPDKRKYRSFVSNALTCTTWYELTKTTNFEELELKNPSSRTQNLLSCYEMDSKTKPSAFPPLSAMSYKTGQLFSDKWPLITYHLLEQYKLEWTRIPVLGFLLHACSYIRPRFSVSRHVVFVSLWGFLAFHLGHVTNMHRSRRPWIIS